MERCVAMIKFIWYLVNKSELKMNNGNELINNSELGNDLLYIYYTPFY